MFPKAATHERIETLDGITIRSGIVIDVCDFGRFYTKIVSVQKRSQVCGFDVAQDLGIYFTYCLVDRKLL